MKKIYTFNSETLEPEIVNTVKYKVYFVGSLLLFFILLSSFISTSYSAKKENKYLTNETEITFKRDADFSQEKLIFEMKRLKIQHPHIALAQMMIETNYFKHPRFKNRSNIAGLRRAGSRITTASGYDDSGFAEFTDWKQSLLDYALLQTGFARGLTEEQYYQWLKSYTHEEDYIKLVKSVIKSKKLKELFA